MKVLDLIHTLSEKEKNHFLDFIKSPYHNKDFELVDYFEILRDKESFSSKEIESIKSQFNWSSSHIRIINNRLVNLFKEYQISEFIKTDPFSIRYCLEAFSFESIERLRNSVFKKGEKHIANHDHPDHISLVFKYMFLRQNAKYASNEDTPSHLAKVKAVLNELNELEATTMELEYQNISMHRIDYSAQEIEPPPNEIVAINKKILELYKTGSFQPLLSSIKTLIKKAPNVSLEIKTNKIVECVNFCAHKLNNEGKQEAYEEIFGLYKFGIENNLDLVDSITYRNIAFIACKVGSYEWGLDFVENYQYVIPPRGRHSAYSYNKAVVQWHSKDYTGVIGTLRNVEYEDINYKLVTRAYLLTCYFELDEYDVLDSSIKAFKVFLRRKRNVPKARKDSYYGFLTILDHLMKASERNDIKRIHKAKEVLDSGPMAFQDWLREKIAETEAVIKK